MSYDHHQVRVMKELTTAYEQVDALERIAEALRPLLAEARAAKAAVATDQTLDYLNRVERDIDEMWGHTEHCMERVVEAGLTPEMYEAWADAVHTRALLAQRPA